MNVDNNLELRIYLNLFLLLTLFETGKYIPLNLHSDIAGNQTDYIGGQCPSSWTREYWPHSQSLPGYVQPYYSSGYMIEIMHDRNELGTSSWTPLVRLQHQRYQSLLLLWHPPEWWSQIQKSLDVDPI